MAGDHGLIGGLRDDDHPQYYNAARLSSWWSGRPPNAHSHVVADITDIGTYYSAVGHSHVEADITDLQSYSLATHLHSGVYSPVAHDHDADYVELAGDTMTGDLTIQKSNANLHIYNTDITTGEFAGIGLQTGGSSWQVWLGTEQDNHWLALYDATRTSLKAAWGSNYYRGGSGSAAAPSVASLDYIDTGLFWPTTDVLSIAVGGAEEFKFTATALDMQGNSIVDLNEITLDIGSASDPSVHFDNSSTTGLFSPSANVLGWSTSSTERMRLLWSELLLADGTHYKADNPLTTGSAVNVTFVNTTGNVYRLQRYVSSSEEYKRDIEFGLEPPVVHAARFLYNPGYVSDDPKGVVPHWGFMAEDVLKAFGPGSVTYKADGTLDDYNLKHVVASLELRIHQLERRAA